MLREETELKQVEVAKRLHLDNSTISGYESGKVNPSFSVLCSMAVLYRVSTDDLFGQTEIRIRPGDLEERL